MLLFFWLSLYGCAAYSLPEATPAKVVGDILGFWQDEADPEYLIGLEESLWTVASSGRVQSVNRVLSREGTEVVLCQRGWRQVWEVRLDPSGSLIVRDPQSAESHRLRRLASKPPELIPDPLPLPKPMPLAPTKIAEIRSRLWELAQDGRGARGQVVEEDPRSLLPWRNPQDGQPPPFSIADLKRVADWSKTVAYLKSVIAEVGWIDVERFGYAASNAAFFIAHHSSDLPLMRAALPGVERDAFANLTEGEDYALLYDRVQLFLGKKQRYGTQIGFDGANRAFVLSIEEPDKVDELRKSLGMMPLADYVRTVARFNHAFSPAAVVFSEDCAE